MVSGASTVHPEPVSYLKEVAHTVRPILAEKDLLKIHSFVSEHAPQALEKIGSKISKALDQSVRFPESGSFVKEFKIKKAGENRLSLPNLDFAPSEFFLDFADRRIGTGDEIVESPHFF